jgi:hypothetical protein
VKSALFLNRNSMALKESFINTMTGVMILHAPKRTDVRNARLITKTYTN